MVRRAWVLMALWLAVSPALAVELPLYLSEPVERILTEYRSAAGVPGNQFKALEAAYGEVEVAFLMLRANSYFQFTPPPPKTCAAYIIAMGEFSRFAQTGQATLLEMIRFFDAGVRFQWGRSPHENQEAQERFRSLRDLPTGELSTAVAARLKEIVLTLEKEAYPETAGAHRYASLSLPQAQLRLLATYLGDFVAIETMRWNPR